MDVEIRDRISLLRFLMICGIVLLHVPPYEPLSAAGESAFSFFKAFFSHAVFRTTVPVLTAISGYLLFRSGLDQNWRQLITRKSKSLLWPLFLFNIILLPLFYVLQFSKTPGLDLSTTIYPFDAWTWLNAVFGITRSPINYPLNFLRDLFVLMLLAPIFGWFLRRMPWIGLALLLAIILDNWDGKLVLRNTMAANFYLGGLAATAQWDLKKLDRYAPVLVCLLVVLSFMIVLFEVEDRKWLAMTAPLMVWPISALLHETLLGRWMIRVSGASFFIFLTHSFALYAVWALYRQFFPALPYPLFWCLAPLTVITGCYLGYQGLSRWMRPVLRGALGGRSL